jgi:hypothetical protein
MKILIIPSNSSDYLQDSVYLGMKDLYGKDVESTSHCHYLYRGSHFNKHHYWGYGFTYTNILDPSLNNAPHDILEKIRDKYYDLIIYSFVSRNSAMLDEVMEVTDGKNVILINGEDEDWRFEHYNEKVIYFKRELVKPEHKNILPINYAIHRSKIFEGDTIKTQEISNSIPSVDNCTNISSSKFIFENEEDYYNDYRISKYGITKKKGGWDSMRHYEIMANKCIPLFENLSECPEYTLTNLPKKLLIEIQNKYPNISESEYKEYSEMLYNFTIENLTTDKMCKNLLNRL